MNTVTTSMESKPTTGRRISKFSTAMQTISIIITVFMGGNFGLAQPVGQVVKLKKKSILVDASAYCSCVLCTGKNPGDRGYGITASGIPARAGVIAVDKRVIKLGTRVRIDGKSYLAADTGSAIRGARIDIFMPSHQAALEFGRKKMLIEF